MTKLISVLAALSLAGTFLTLATPGHSMPVVRQIPQSQAQGLSHSGAQISVWPGSGTNIDFTHTGETILKAWIDDPSYVTLDFDGTLERNASIVHLKRVEGIKFPNLPQSRSTLLTVITGSTYGRKTYLFQINYGKGKPQYAAVTIAGNSPALSRTGSTSETGQGSAWTDIERGLSSAIQQGLVTSTSPVVRRVKLFLTLTRNGLPISQAAARVKLPIPVLTRLAEMGRSPTLSPLAPNSKSEAVIF